MVSHLFFYQLTLSALVWRYVMLQGAWFSDATTAGPTPPPPTPPRRKHRREPTPFAGLTGKPPCDACAPASDRRAAVPCTPPPRRVPPRGPRRPVDTSTHCCPHPACAYWGWAGWGQLRAQGHPKGGPWRQLLCGACRRDGLATLGPILHGQRASVERIVRVIACLAAGLGIRGTARGFAVAPHTVLQWCVAAAEKLQAFSRHVLQDVRVRQGPLDALFAWLRAVQDGEGNAAEALARLERSHQWVGGAMAPASKVLLTIAVGERPLALAPRVVHHGAQVLAPDGAPLCLSDGCREYLTALRTHYGQWGQPPRRQVKGPVPQPRWLPLPQLLEAQVVKPVRQRRLGRVRPRVVFGTLEAVHAGWAPLGCQLNPALIERLNLSRRQHGAAVGRRGSTRGKGEDGLRQQLAL